MTGQKTFCTTPLCGERIQCLFDVCNYCLDPEESRVSRIDVSEPPGFHCFPHDIPVSLISMQHFLRWNEDAKHGRHWQTLMWLPSPVSGAVRIMPAVGRGVPGTSTGVIETDSASTQLPILHSKSGWSVLSGSDSHLLPGTHCILCAYTSAHFSKK